MNQIEKIYFWSLIIDIGKVVAYLLFMAAMIKYLWS